MTDYAPEFDNDIWPVLRTLRPVHNSKSKAYKAYVARLKQSKDWLAEHRLIIDGLERYTTYCKAEGISGSRWVMQGATFLGPDRHYTNDYTVKPSAPYHREAPQEITRKPVQSMDRITKELDKLQGMMKR